MTDLEINKAIHTFIMGECAMPTVDIDPTWEKFDEDGICRECNRGIGDHTRIPKYTSDLNAVRRAEMKVDWLTYGGALYKITNPTNSVFMDNHQYAGWVCAASRQRAEAVLRATGNWEEK